VSYPPPLTSDEQENVRRAIRYLWGRAGAWTVTASILGVRTRTLRRIRAGRPVARYMARKVAKAMAVPVGDVKTGKAIPTGTCRHCGRTASDAS